MKKIITTTVLFALVFFTPVQARTSYVLMCKGGGNMNIDYDSVRNKLTVNFKAGNRGGSHGVSAGNCTWVDRGFRPREPHRLCQLGVNDVKFRMNGADKVVRLSSSKAPYIKNILRGRAFQVRVYNDNAGCMRVTKPGP